MAHQGIKDNLQEIIPGHFGADYCGVVYWGKGDTSSCAFQDIKLKIDKDFL